MGIFSGYGRGNQHEYAKDVKNSLLRIGGKFDYLASKGWANRA